MSGFRLSKRHAYIIAISASLLNFVTNYPMYQLSPMSQELMTSLQINEAQFSMLFTAAMIPGFLFSIISGVLCDKFGAKACISAAGLISFLAVIGRIFANSYPTLFLCMFLSGLVCTFLNANLAKIMANWFLPEKISGGVGISFAGASASMVLAMGTTALFPSMRSAFVFAAGLNAAVLLVWLLFMKDTPADEAPETTQPVQTSMGKRLLTVAKNRHIWVAGLSVGLINAAGMCISAFLPQALQAGRGMSVVEAGAVSAAMMVGRMVGAVLGPIICSKIGNLKTFLVTFSAISAVGTAFVWRMPAGPMLIGGLFLTGFVCSGLGSQLLAVPVMLKEIGPSLAGAAGGFAMTIQILLIVGLPSYLIAPLTGDNYTLLYLIGGALALIAGGLTLLLPELSVRAGRKTPRPMADR